MAIKISGTTVIDNSRNANNIVNLTASGQLIAGSYNETLSAVTSSGGAATANCESGNLFSILLSEDTTFTFSNPPAGPSGTYGMSIVVVQDTTPRAITWPASVNWPSATAPTLTATSGGVDVFTFFTISSGASWYGVTSGQAFG